MTRHDTGFGLALIIALSIALGAVVVGVYGSSPHTVTKVPEGCTKAALAAQQALNVWQVRDDWHSQAEQAALGRITVRQFRQMLAEAPAAPGIVRLGVCK